MRRKNKEALKSEEYRRTEEDFSKKVKKAD